MENIEIFTHTQTQMQIPRLTGALIEAIFLNSSQEISKTMNQE